MQPFPAKMLLFLNCFQPNHTAVTQCYTTDGGSSLWPAHTFLAPTPIHLKRSDVTLGLILINRDQAIQIADRRLTRNGAIVTEESEKSCVVITNDARLSMMYSGMAQVGPFRMFQCLLDNILECAKPDFIAQNMINRLVRKLNDLFASNPLIRGLDNEHKRTSIILSGYHYGFAPPLAVVAILSNFPIGTDDWSAGDESGRFHVVFENERLESRIETFSYVQKIGWWPAVTDSDVDVLRRLLVQGRPATTIIGAGEDLFRSIAERPTAGGTIGKQLNIIALPRDPERPAISYYSVGHTTRETVMSSMVVATGNAQSIVTGIRIEPVEADAPPMSLARVRRSERCPCGSGLKYKRCHGRRLIL